MPKYRWPTDPPGKPASHSVMWESLTPEQRMSFAHGAGVQYDPTLMFRDRNVTSGGAPPAAGTVPQPFDPSLAWAQQQATWQRGIADSEARYQQGETAWSLGYNADGSLNTSNPYAQAQLLQDNYRRSVTGTDNSMAAQGQLYSGARVNAQARNDRLYAESSSALRDEARRTYHGIASGQLQSYGQNAMGLTQEQWDALRRSVYGG